MFTTMMDGIKEESVGFLFNVEVQIDEEPPQQPAGLIATGPSLDSSGRSADIGIVGEPVPSSAPAAFGDGLESQTAGHADDRARVAGVLGQAIGAPNRPANLSYTAPTVDGDGGVTRSSGPGGGGGGGSYGNVSRNAPCPCGSGRKFKRCHGSSDPR